jgi:hypothetical protein
MNHRLAVLTGGAVALAGDKGALAEQARKKYAPPKKQG